MNVSRVKPTLPVKGSETLLVEDFLLQRDYLGAITLLEFQRSVGERGEDAALWLGYCAFHLGDYSKAMEEYTAMTEKPDCRPEMWVNLACTLFFLGLYNEAEEAALKAPKSKLQNRLLFHLAHKFSDEEQLMRHHQSLEDVPEDQLSLASMNIMRTHYQNAMDTYKVLLLQNRDYLAVNVYVALCYYKMYYYDVCRDILAVYMRRDPDSPIALNLMACNQFKLSNGKAAEFVLKNLIDVSSSSFGFVRDLIRHNTVVFRRGKGALQVLPTLIDVIPEARLNLAIYYLRQDNIQESYSLIKDLEPTTPQEYILKAVVNATLGLDISLREHLKTAQQFYQVVGSLSGECDTLSGRQCMASWYFLLGQFRDAVIYLNSIKSYLYNDDTFNFNYGQTQAAMGNYRNGELIFLQIHSHKIKCDFVYLSWLARCYIMNQKPGRAWEVYQQMKTPADSFRLLQLLANDCYKMGQFYISAKAFEALEHLDPTHDYLEGKMGACVGVFQMVLAKKEPRNSLKEVMHLLRNTDRPEAEYILKILGEWENRTPL